jgi:hypothetical protein
MWPRIASPLISILGIPVAGCGPSVSDDELGRIVADVPAIPAGYEPYTLPDLTPPDATEPDAERAVQSLQPDDSP